VAEHGQPAVVSAAANAGDVRTDTPSGDLANYCLHALSAATAATSNAAVDRLIGFILRSVRG
jgi:hypothetical protein